VLAFHKTSYKSILGGLGFGFPKQSTLSEWKKRVMKNEPPRGVPGGNRVAILSEAERNHLIDAIYGIGNAGAKVGLKLVRRLTTAILAVSGKAYISGPNKAVFPSKAWCQQVFTEMGYSKRRGTRASRRQSDGEISEIQRNLVLQIAFDVKKYSLSKGCVGNFDETGVFLFRQSNSTMAQTNAKQVNLVGHSEKRQYTLNNFGTADGDFAPLQIIFAGVWGKKRAVPKLNVPIAGLKGSLLTQTKDHWQTGESMIEYYEKIILPFVDRKRRDAGNANGHFLLLVDVYPSHLVVAFRQWCKKNRILLHYIYPGLTGELQPMDIAVQGPFKDFVTAFMEEYYQGLINEHMSANNNKFDNFDFAMKKSNLALPFLEAVGKANEKLMGHDGDKIRLLGWRIFENCWDVETQAEAEQKAVEWTLWPKAKGGKKSKAVVIEAMIAAEKLKRKWRQR
jgi:hypothetical protein